VPLIALGITGGIGAYKAVEVCRLLQQRGHEVAAVMTRAATRFVGPVTLEAITGRPVLTSPWRPGANADIAHVALADRIALLLVAPCTAHALARFAHGLADDPLGALYLATKAPVLVAPAMNVNMLSHPAVVDNLRILRARGIHLVEPGEGYLACGWIGRGRLADPAAIVEAALRLIERPPSPLRDRRVVVTAGPTYEDIDAVRFVGNRSSGRMGFAIAAEARARGARVTLVAGPTRIDAPAVDDLVRVRSAAEMHEAVMRAAPAADVVVMAAAVADYTPADPASAKIAKQDGPMTLTLHRTPDILAALGAMRAASGRARPLLVGFAAETGDLLRKARDKRVRKQVDLIVANDVSEPGAGFDVETNAVTIVGPDGEEPVPLAAKAQVAARLLDRIEARLIAGDVAART
jgi:phosphopantothenoylcysteine decarboxylase / phosphopantothenate---cysteine ligase